MVKRIIGMGDIGRWKGGPYGVKVNIKFVRVPRSILNAAGGKG